LCGTATACRLITKSEQQNKSKQGNGQDRKKKEKQITTNLIKSES
jgi:hypothetical protein